MKKLMFVVLAAFLLSGTSANAQFFKKLKKKVTDKVENAVIKNISEKAAKETDDALNNVWEMDLKNMNVGMGSPIDLAEVPDTYSFDWKYSLNMKTKDGGMDFVYRLKKDADYMGMAIPKMAKMFIVMDTGKEMTVMYMNGMVRATKMKTELPENTKAENPYADMEYKKIGSKSILGYDCDGYRAESKDYVFTMYVTDDVGIGFNQLYKNQKNLPKGFDPDWISEESLLMEMQMDSKINPNKSMTMSCTGIKKEDFTISKQKKGGN